MSGFSFILGLCVDDFTTQYFSGLVLTGECFCVPANIFTLSVL